VILGGLRAFVEHENHHLKDEYEQWNKQKSSGKNFTHFFTVQTNAVVLCASLELQLAKSG